jgi:hypothetical protein
MSGGVFMIRRGEGGCGCTKERVSVGALEDVYAVD